LDEERAKAEYERLPLCAPGAWVESDIYDHRPNATCRAPRECSKDYWLGIRHINQATGPVLPAQAFSNGRCVVRSGRGFSGWVTVTPDEGAPFVVMVNGHEAAVIPGAKDDSSAVELTGILRFQGRRRLRTFGVRAELELAEGRILTGSGTRASIREVKGKQVVAELELADDVKVKGASLPCTELRATEESMWPPPQRIVDSHARPLKEAVFPLFVGARGTSPIEVVAPSAFVFEESGGRTRIGIPMSDGALLRGWIANDVIDPEDGGGGMGYGFSGGGCGCGRDPDPTVRVVVRKGVGVFATPGAGRWASVVLDVELPALEVNGEWFRLLEVYGLSSTHSSDSGGCGDFAQVFVRKSDVRVTKVIDPRGEFQLADHRPRFLDARAPELSGR